MANKLLLNFSGGINLQASALIIKDNEAELILNYILDRVGALYRRYGYLRFLNQPVAGATINGLYEFNDTSTATAFQLMVANNAANTQGVIYYNNINIGAWTAAKTDDTAGLRTRFSTFVDYAFRVNGTDVMASTANGATWGTTNCPADITPKYTGVFQDRVYAANGGGTTGSRLWFSSLPDGSGGITWSPDTDYVDVNPDDGDSITGLENNGNRFLIFKNRSMYRWTFGQVEPDRLIGVGSPSQENIKTNLDRGITFFANPNGVYAYSGNRPKLISRKIQPFIDAVTDWPNTCAEVDYDHYYLSVGDIRMPVVWGQNSSFEYRTFTNCILVYHISLDAWTVWTYGTPVKFMARLQTILSEPEKIYFGSNDGRTYQMNVGTQDDVSAQQLPIEAEFTSKEYMLSFPNRSDIRGLDFFAQQRANADVFFDTDRTQLWTGLGKLRGRITDFKPVDRECNTVQVRLSDNSKFRTIFEGFNVEYEPKPVRFRDNSAIRRRRP